MSYNTRDQARRKVKQSINASNTVCTYMQWFEETYREHHPELADVAEVIAAVQMQVEELLESFLSSF